MVLSPKTIAKIKEIIELKYAQLTLSILGKDLFSKEELKALQDAGVKVDDRTSLIELIYNHNYINNPPGPDAPKSVPGMEMQQDKPGIKPKGATAEYTVSAANAQVKEYIDKLASDVQAQFNGIFKKVNDEFKLDFMRDPKIASKEASVAKIKQMMRDATGQAARDWNRVALTEMSNVIGQGSVDRIVDDNEGKELNEVYVYRIIVGDAVTCKHCRKFYGDVGEPPKLYRLTTLLANGSNFGLKAPDWKPVVGATHPNTRTSAIVELRPGFKVLPGGKTEYIGLEHWEAYIKKNLHG